MRRHGGAAPVAPTQASISAKAGESRDSRHPIARVVNRVTILPLASFRKRRFRFAAAQLGKSLLFRVRGILSEAVLPSARQSVEGVASPGGHPRVSISGDYHDQPL